jgi:amino acid transporter
MVATMQRTLTTSALLFASISAIIGSGWLFSSYYAARLAGSAALLAWIIGGIAIICVAFVFAEICALIPIAGASTRIPQFTHGTIISFLFSWIIWLSYAAFPPIETQAVIQYANFYFPGLTFPTGGLTKIGYISATVLMLFISAINVYALRWLIRCNNFLTILKMIIPIFVSLVLIALFFNLHKVIHTNNSPFMPFGLHGVFYALASGGIIFAFNGFKQVAEMGGETKNPKKSLPLAIIGSIVICLIIYALLQTAFLSALESSNLA